MTTPEIINHLLVIQATGTVSHEAGSYTALREAIAVLERLQGMIGVPNSMDLGLQAETADGIEEKFVQFGCAHLVAPIANPHQVAMFLSGRELTAMYRTCDDPRAEDRRGGPSPSAIQTPVDASRRAARAQTPPAAARSAIAP